MLPKINHSFIKAVSVFLLACALFSCGTLRRPYYGKQVRDWQQVAPPDSADLKYTVYLVGDAGDPAGEPLLEILEKHLTARDTLMIDISRGDTLGKTASNSKDVIVFLGDNIYYNGLPSEQANNREEKEAIINRQMDALKGFKGAKFFIPGNHDWNASKPDGLQAVLRQEAYVESYGDSTITWLPSQGCPGPYELHLNDDLVILFIDTEWYLTKNEKPRGPENDCHVEDRFDFMVQLEDAVERNKQKNILIVQHHPLFSNSNHGGHFSLKDNIFPLTLVRDKLYIPLPLIGSLYPLLRKYGVSRQDIPNPVYQHLIRGMLSIIEDRGNVVVASGHDHNLQLIKHEQLSQIISGSGSKSNFAARRGDASFVYQHFGFSKINYYDNGEVWVEYWVTDQDKSMGKLVFRSPLYALNPSGAEAEENTATVDYSDSVKVAAAGPEYKAGRFKEFWLGEHYREVWTTPIQVPYLSLQTEAGGLTPVQKGGGNQTISLRMMNPDSVQYTLRTVNKNPQGAIPSPLYNTFAEDLVKDQISSAHPYGALALTKMSEALGLFHTKPKLFYVPHTPLLGPYIDDFGGRMVLFEIRPDEDLSQFKQFGYSENVVSTRTMLRHLREDNDNEVDARMYLKNRIFDMLVNDWDRHEDQWRWSEFEKDKGSLFKPVPRDRDQVFTRFDGLLPYLVSRRWAIRRFHNFDYKVKDVIGLNAAAKWLDRELLSGLSKKDWQEIGDSVQLQLTDEVIDEAMRDLPSEIYDISGPVIAAKLKSRRDDVDRFLQEYYNVLAKNVNIVFSDKHELCSVERLSDEKTRVRVYKTKKNNVVKGLLFDRTFTLDETAEIRLYGLGGQDSILLTGEASNGITLRVIGGSGDDVIIDQGKGGKVYVYDQKTESNHIESGKDIKLRLSKKDEVNEYDREEFKYDYYGPRLFIEYNRDDGLYLGGGAFLQTNGFRKNPKSDHSILANYAMNTGSFTLQYEGTFYSLPARNWDLNLFASSYGPKYIFNYFGQGNSTPGLYEKEGTGIDYFRVNMNRIQIAPTLQHRLTGFLTLGFGPRFNYYDIKENGHTILSDTGLPEAREETYFGGTTLFADLDLLNHPVHPTRGVAWHGEFNYNHELGTGTKEFTSVLTDASLYISPVLPFDLTAAFRFGAAHNFGEFNFYQSHFLGGDTNLRGFRTTRFAGRSSIYSNMELRLGLFPINGYILNGNLGVSGFYDTGRVWSDTEGESNSWHKGYGPGVWLQLYELLLLSVDYGISDEGNFFNLRFGHFF